MSLFTLSFSLLFCVFCRFRRFCFYAFFVNCFATFYIRKTPFPMFFGGEEEGSGRRRKCEQAIERHTFLPRAAFPVYSTAAAPMPPSSHTHGVRVGLADS